MPEGDSIWLDAARLRPVLAGRELSFVDGRDRRALRGLTKATVENIETVGKHLLFSFSDASTLRVHLGMKGSWNVAPLSRRRPQNFDRTGIVLETAAGRAICQFPKVVDRFPTRERPTHAVLSQLGPDLLADDVDVAEILARARAGDRGQLTLAELLLDQTVACGIGNVYKAEVLFIERQSPFRHVDGVEDETLRRLYATAERLMKANLRPGPRNTTGRRFPETWIYGATRRGCPRCRGRVSTEKHGGGIPRITWWCPRCQPPPPA